MTRPAENLMAEWEATFRYWRESGIAFLSREPTGPDLKPGRGPEAMASPGESVPSPLPADLPERDAVPKRRAKPMPVPALPVAPPPILAAPAMAEAVRAEIPLPERADLMAAMAEEVRQCRRCGLAQTRTQTVFGVGSWQATVVFVGEAPGADEDRLGEPFVGMAGKLLDRMIRAVGWRREDVYIANVLKCRPPGNRNPLPEEVAFCQNYLYRQLEAIKPQAIFALGRFGIQCLLGEFHSISQMRGRVHEWRGIPVIASYHPAYYLRSPGRKSAAWTDLQLLLSVLDRKTNG